MTSLGVKLKLNIMKIKFKIVVMNLPFISSHEARKSVFAFFASFDEINGKFIPKT